jgi:hypothetical protein
MRDNGKGNVRGKSGGLVLGRLCEGAFGICSVDLFLTALRVLLVQVRCQGSGQGISCRGFRELGKKSQMLM